MNKAITKYIQNKLEKSRDSARKKPYINKEANENKESQSLCKEIKNYKHK